MYITKLNFKNFKTLEILSLNYYKYIYLYIYIYIYIY